MTDITPEPTTNEDRFDERFPLVLYRHDNGELMMPVTHVTALLRHVAETVRLWRVRGQVPLDLMTTARIYDALVHYAADLDTAIDGAHGQCDPADRTRADEAARHLDEVASAYLAAG
ncbi:hypothetical protein P3T27_008123 [Kitasatospora sp. MAA19]|uniref:hypothetical protein n=1 Tax=Kitasatospora sp. MAA19 TaxID=3035090 RepID=UPI002475435D|nr:hypothetical protein [Kitasatospora sp. MAA19]MDH6711365.1 hypothetical protein [Kitasatospora sp. MAA19]